MLVEKLYLSPGRPKNNAKILQKNNTILAQIETFFKLTGNKFDRKFKKIQLIWKNH